MNLIKNYGLLYNLYDLDNMLMYDQGNNHVENILYVLYKHIILCCFLHKLFVDHELFVIFVQSPHYYESVVSLNEMGAAWVLKTNYCSILTKEMCKEEMKGVVDSNTIFIKVNTPEATARLNDLKKTLTEIFNLKLISESTWERKRNMFLKTVTSSE